jgi:hypothetical protein
MNENNEVRGRCPQDEDPRFGCQIQLGNFQFVADEGEVAGINAVMSVMTTLAAIMCGGVKPDYMERVALGVLSKIVPAGDPHMLCPLANIVQGITATLDFSAVVAYDKVLDQLTFVDRIDLVEGEVKPPSPPKDVNDGGGILGEQVQ